MQVSLLRRQHQFVCSLFRAGLCCVACSASGPNPSRGTSAIEAWSSSCGLGYIGVPDYRRT
jgi:hypothetical protein